MPYVTSLIAIIAPFLLFFVISLICCICRPICCVCDKCCPPCGCCRRDYLEKPLEDGEFGLGSCCIYFWALVIIGCGIYAYVTLEDLKGIFDPLKCATLAALDEANFGLTLGTLKWAVISDKTILNLLFLDIILRNPIPINILILNL